MPWPNRAKGSLLLHDWAEAQRDYDVALADPIYRSRRVSATALYGRGAARPRLGEAQRHDGLTPVTARLPGVVTDFAKLGITP